MPSHRLTGQEGNLQEPMGEGVYLIPSAARGGNSLTSHIVIVTISFYNLELFYGSIIDVGFVFFRNVIGSSLIHGFLHRYSPTLFINNDKS